MPRTKNYLLRSLFSDSDNGETVCNNGDCQSRILSSHAGNLERHLKVVHNDIYNKYIEKKGSLAWKKAKFKSMNSESYNEYMKKRACLTLNKTKCKSNNSNILEYNEYIKEEEDETLENTENAAPEISCSIDKNTAEMAIIELFTKCGCPLSMVEKRPFKILTKLVFDALHMELNQHNLIEKIVQHSCNLKQEISRQLKGRLLSLKVDAATRQHLSVLSINVQFIENNCITIRTLAIKELKERHTIYSLKAMILEVLSEYGIELNQIYTISTDNGANMIKAATDLIEESNCEMERVDGFCPNIDFTMDNITNMRIGAHTLQLCAMDVIKEKDIESQLNNLRTVSKKLSTPTYQSLLRNGGYRNPIVDCPARWSSTYLMLERLMELKDFIDLMGKDDADLKICADNWTFVAEFLQTFKIIYMASIKLQSHDLIYSDLCIQMMNVSLQLDSLSNCKMASTLKSAVRTRKAELLDNDLFVAAVFVDPRIKTTLSAEQVARAKNCLISLHARLSSLKENESNCVSPSMSSSNNPSMSPTVPTLVDNFEDPLEAYLQSFDKQENADEASGRKIIERDFLLYEQLSRLGINENVLQFWSSQKSALSDIANVVLAIPCTQVSVERLFSSLEYIFADQRNSLSSTILEHILLVRANDDFTYNDGFACED